MRNKSGFTKSRILKVLDILALKLKKDLRYSTLHKYRIILTVVQYGGVGTGFQMSGFISVKENQMLIFSFCNSVNLEGFEKIKKVEQR